MPTQARYLRSLLGGIWYTYHYQSTLERFEIFTKDCLSICNGIYESNRVNPGYMILGLLYDDLEQVQPIISVNAQDNELQASCLALVQATHTLRKTQDTQSLFPDIWHTCEGISEPFDHTWRKIGHVLGMGSIRHAMRHIGTDASPHTIVTQAAYCFLRYSDNYEAMLKATTQSVDSLTVSIIASGLFGVHHYDDSVFKIDEDTESTIGIFIAKLMYSSKQQTDIGANDDS